MNNKKIVNQLGGEYNEKLQNWKKVICNIWRIIALLILTVAVALTSLNDTSGNFEDFYTNGYPVSNKTTEVRRELRAALSALSSMLTTDTAKNQEYISKVVSEMADLTQGFQYLRENFRGDQGIIEEAEALLDQSKQYRSQILELSEQNKNDEAAQIFFDQYEPIIEQAMDKMQNIDVATTDLAAENFE